MRALLCVLVVAVVGLQVRAATRQVTVKELETEMLSSYPVFRRVGAVSPHGESSPFVFKGTLYRMELADPTRGLDMGHAGIHSEIREALTGRFVASLAAGCYYTSVYAEADRVYVTGTLLVKEANGRTRTGDTIMLFASDDLVHWKSRVLFQRKGRRFYNTSMTKDADGYAIVTESDRKGFDGQFSMYFARSRDMIGWEFLEDERAFPPNRYAGGPFLVYRKGWYYLSLVTALPCRRYNTYLYRTRDLWNWEVGRYNPLLDIVNDDRKVAPEAHSLDDKAREEIARKFVCSLSDVEMCDYEGKTYVTYGIGDQQGFYYSAAAWYDGGMDKLLADFFR